LKIVIPSRRSRFAPVSNVCASSRDGVPMIIEAALADVFRCSLLVAEEICHDQDQYTHEGMARQRR
jgi:hypothetical protein